MYYSVFPGDDIFNSSYIWQTMVFIYSLLYLVMNQHFTRIGVTFYQIVGMTNEL